MEQGISSHSQAIDVGRKPVTNTKILEVMGLDSVEILMKVEETFAIKIPDQEAEKIITVGDFHNSVWRHLSNRPISDKCHSQGLFYRLRKLISETYKFPKQHIELNSSPNDIFPKSDRRQSYLQFSTINSLKLPDLVLAPTWTTVLTTFGILTVPGGLLLSIILINIFDYTKWTLLIPVAGVFLTMAVSEILDPKRTIIKSTTIKDFTKETLALNYTTLVKEVGTNRKEMESVINHIIADMAGLELEEITPEKKICDDLGID